MNDVVILSACRTPIGNFGGMLRDIPVEKLGAVGVKEAVNRAGVRGEEIDEVIMGNVISAGLGQNPARQASIYAGLPVDIPAFTLNKVCGSGLKSVIAGALAIRCGDAKIVVAGGMESMTRSPYLLRKARFGYKLMNGELTDAMVYDGLWDKYNDFHMGMTGELIAEKYSVSRKDADRFALRSNQRAIDATKTGKFKNEILPIKIEQRRKQDFIFEKDEGPREDTSMAALSKLKPVFKKDGIVTAGNASKISDGASALVIADKNKAKDRDIPWIAEIKDYASSGVKPKWVMEAPIPCVKKLCMRNNLSISDIDLFEHNEAFATASVVVQKELKVPDEKFNVHGGAVALGHPIGASGARVLTTLLYAMRAHDTHRGLCVLCLGGGNAVGMVVER